MVRFDGGNRGLNGNSPLAQPRNVVHFELLVLAANVLGSATVLSLFETLRRRQRLGVHFAQGVNEPSGRWVGGLCPPWMRVVTRMNKTVR